MQSIKKLSTQFTLAVLTLSLVPVLALAAAIPNDSDSSADYLTKPIANTVSKDSYPDLFVKGATQGIYSGTTGSVSYVFGGDPTNPTAVKTTNDAYSTVNDYCLDQTHLVEGYIDRNRQLNFVSVASPGGYICQAGAFVAVATLTITSTSLPQAQAHSAYSAQVSFTYNGTHTLTATWSGLPSGITGSGPYNGNPNVTSGITASSGTNTLALKGTSDVAGTYTVSLNIVDQYGATVTSQFSLVVASSETIVGQTATLSTSSPAAATHNAGQKAADFTHITILSGLKDITINSIVVKGNLVQGMWTDDSSLSNIQICPIGRTTNSTATCYGTAAALTPNSADPTMGTAEIALSNIALVSYAKQDLVILVDVGVKARGTFSLGISKVNYTETVSKLVGSMEVSVTGYQQTIISGDSIPASAAPATTAPTVTTPAAIPPEARHPRATVVVDPTGTVFFLGTEIRYPFPSAEVFFSWGHKFSDVVKANSADLDMPLGPVAEMKK